MGYAVTTKSDNRGDAGNRSQIPACGRVAPQGFDVVRDRNGHGLGTVTPNQA